MRRFAVLLPWLLLANVAVSADDAAPLVRPVGEVFFQGAWTVGGPEDSSRDAFSVTRVELGADAAIGRRFTARALLSAEPEDGRWSPAAKQAWIDLRLFTPLAVRVGILPTAWIAFVGEAYALRFVAKTPTDLWFKRPETDLGVALHGEFPGGYGSWHLGLTNGQGFAAPETTAGKAVDLRLTTAFFQAVPALRKLTFSVHGRYEKVDPDLEELITQYGVLVHWRHDFAAGIGVNLGASMDFASFSPRANPEPDEIVNSLAVSGFADVRIGSLVSVFVRGDYFDPDTENRKDLHGYRDETDLLIAGIAVAPDPRAALALDYRRVGYSAPNRGDGGKRTPEHVLALQGRVAF
jgi:hypothetical protein